MRLFRQLFVFLLHPFDWILFDSLIQSFCSRDSIGATGRYEGILLYRPEARERPFSTIKTTPGRAVTCVPTFLGDSIILAHAPFPHYGLTTYLVNFYNAETSKPVFGLQWPGRRNRERRVVELLCSPTSNGLFVAGTTTSEIGIWRCPVSYQMSQSYRHPPTSRNTSITSLAFLSTPSGQRLLLLSGSGRTVESWDLLRNENVKRHRHRGSVRAIAVRSPSTQLGTNEEPISFRGLVAVAAGDTVNIFPSADLATPQRQIFVPTQSLLWHPTNPNLLFLGETRGSISLWDMRIIARHVERSVVVPGGHSVNKMIGLGCGRFACAAVGSSIPIFNERLRPYEDVPVLSAEIDPFLRKNQTMDIHCLAPFRSRMQVEDMLERFGFLLDCIERTVESGVVVAEVRLGWGQVLESSPCLFVVGDC